MRRIVLVLAVAALALAGMRWWSVSGRRAATSKAAGGSSGPLSASSAARIAAGRAHRPDAVPRWPHSPFPAQGRKLSGLSPEERRQLNERLLSQTAGALLDLWFQEASIKQDGLWLDLIANALAFQLRKEEGEVAAVVGSMAAFAKDPGHDDFLRWRMVETLGEVATPGALKAILDLARFAEAHPDLQPIVLRQIARIGDIRWDGRFHEELSPLLEKSWNEDAANSLLDEAISMAMAKVGTPGSVELLLKDAALRGPSISDLESSGDTRAWFAFEALDLIRNVHSIPVLSASLVEGQPGDVQMLAAGEALSCMGRPEATKVLLDWAQGSGQDVSGYAENWLSKMRDQISVDLVSEAVANGAFTMSANQKAVQRVLSDWRKHHS